MLENYFRCDLPGKAMKLLYMMNNSTTINKRRRYFNTNETVHPFFVKWHVKPNTRSYNTYIKAMRGQRFSSIDEFLNIISDMRKNDNQPDSITINTIVDVAVQAKDFQTAEKVSTNYI